MSSLPGIQISIHFRSDAFAIASKLSVVAKRSWNMGGSPIENAFAWKDQPKGRHGDRLALQAK
jgi:hypothetical protein